MRLPACSIAGWRLHCLRGSPHSMREAFRPSQRPLAYARRLKSAQGNKTISALTSLNCPRRVLLTGTPLQNNLGVRGGVGWGVGGVGAIASLPHRSGSPIASGPRSLGCLGQRMKTTALAVCPQSHTPISRPPAGVLCHGGLCLPAGVGPAWASPQPSAAFSLGCQRSACVPAAACVRMKPRLAPRCWARCRPLSASLAGPSPSRATATPAPKRRRWATCAARE